MPTPSVPGYAPSAQALTLMRTNYADLPAANTTEGMVYFCPDAPGGMSMVVSDGVYYRPFARGNQAEVATLDASGNATWTFSPPFSAVPIVAYMVENPASAQPVTVDITAISTTSVSVHGYRAQTLPTSILSLVGLQNFNVFGGASLSGVKVHLKASLKTS